MRKLSSLILLIVAFSLAGCAATGPLFQKASPPDHGKALIYIYRPSSFMLGGRDAYFYINDKNIADVSAQGYTQIYLEPGTYNLKQKWPIDLMGFKNLELPLIVEPNNTYYFRFYSGAGAAGGCGPQNMVGTCFEWSLQQVSWADAMPEISHCHYQTAK
ncbi:MAG: DUF2846 domain-containing protein [Pseudomonadota bacterium]